MVPKPAWLIFLASFVVYQANLRPVAALDSLPAALLPFSILLDCSLHLDRFAAYLMQGQPRTPYYLHEKNGHYYTAYSIAQPFLLTPLYVPVCAALSRTRWDLGDQLLQHAGEQETAPVLPVAQFLAGLSGILFSPGRGLLVYCPFLIFAVAGAVAWRKSLLLSVSAMFCLAHLVRVSCVPEWWGGACWGPRLLTEMMPFLILLILPALDAVMARAWLRSVFACLLLYSMFVQFIGAFCYPNGRWDSTPAGANFSERLWNWVDNPIHRTVRAGLYLIPHQIALEGALHGKTAAVRKMRGMGIKGF